MRTRDLHIKVTLIDNDEDQIRIEIDSYEPTAIPNALRYLADAIDTENGLAG